MRDLVAALEAIYASDIVISALPFRPRGIGGLNWPGRSEGLTDRESEILALITQGHSNAEVATLTHLSPNTVNLHPNDLSQDRPHEPHPGGSVGRPPWLHTRPSPHRPLARRALTAAGSDGKSRY